MKNILNVFPTIPNFCYFEVASNQKSSF